MLEVFGANCKPRICKRRGRSPPTVPNLCFTQIRPLSSSWIKMKESSLSEAQDMTLSILPCLTSSLSCLGSAQIIFMVLTARKTTPYRRILLGLSVSDFLCSLVYPWQAFLVPQATSYRIWAIGNDRTCAFLGFSLQIFFASIHPNCPLRNV